MKILIMKMMVLISSLSMTLKNPISMGMMLMMQTTLMSMFMASSMKSSWFSMITFIMMVGGIMILFIYMSTVASNEKFKMNFKIIFMITIMMLIQEELMIEYQIEEELTMKQNQESISMVKMYNKSFMTMIIMISYLIITMISINKIIKFNKGPMRSKN